MTTNKPLAIIEKCHGEAHSNPYIDNCGVCAPNWGFNLYCANCGVKLQPTQNGEHIKTTCHKCGTRHAKADYSALFYKAE